MKKSKSLVAMLLAATLMAGSVVPAFAAVTWSRTYNDGSVYVRTDNAAKYNDFPVWIWKQGYCYYYDSPTNCLKNGTTPDGYTVDELGRWVIDGVPVHNGLGSVKVGTDEYLGKSSDEIWSIIRNKTINIFDNALTCCVNNHQYAYGYDENMVWHDFDDRLSGRGESYIQHDHPYYNTFITATIGNEWSDRAENGVDSMVMAVEAAKPDMKEKLIKTIVGDNIGQELFNYINQHANKRGSGYIVDLNSPTGYYTWDLDGNRIFIEDPTRSSHKTVWTDYLGDGINSSTMDLSMWQNRKTDYGKTFSVVDDGGALAIHVYN